MHAHVVLSIFKYRLFKIMDYKANLENTNYILIKHFAITATIFVPTVCLLLITRIVTSLIKTWVVLEKESTVTMFWHSMFLYSDKKHIYERDVHLNWLIQSNSFQFVSLLFQRIYTFENTNDLMCLYNKACKHTTLLIHPDVL